MQIRTSKNRGITIKGAKAFALLALFLIPNYTIAASLDQQIRDAESKLYQTQSQKKSLNSEVAGFDGQINSVQNQIYATSREINKIQGNITQAKTKIREAETELNKTRNQLSEFIRVMYEEGQVTELELIAMSNNFSDFVNRTEYLESMNLKMKDTTDKIINLKNGLEAKKKELEESKKRTEKLKSEQLEQKRELSESRAAKNFLLGQTKGLESNYQSLLKQLYAERAAAAASSGQTFGGSGSGGYPYSNRCGIVDPWRFYTCQCTGYAAWKWNSIGKDWTNTRPGSGNAYQWTNLAGDQGYSVSPTPRVGSLAIWPVHSLDSAHYYDVYGHVAYVTGVNGSTISVSEYNFATPEGYGTRGNVPISWRNNYNGRYYSLSFIY